MALEIEIKKDVFENLDDSLKEHYKEHGEGDNVVYRLDADLDFADELKGALSKERELRKENERKAKELEDKIKEENKKKLEQDGQWKELFEEQKKENEQLKQNNLKIQKDNTIDRIASTLTKDKNKSKMLKMVLGDNITVEDGKTKIVNIPGVESESELVEHCKKQYGFLIDGSKSTGGGADGGEDGKSQGLLTKEEVRELPEHEKQAYFKKHGYNKFRKE